jgi:hypothetical protein
MTPTGYLYSLQNDFPPDHIVDAVRLGNTIRASGMSSFEYINTTTDECEIFFGDVLPSGQADILDWIVSQHANLVLDREKVKRCILIDNKTDEIILRGFSFDSKTFKMDAEARANYHSLHYFVNVGFIPLPAALNTIDEQIYYVTSSGQLNQFVGTGIQSYYTALQGGWALKVQVRACTTVEQVWAIVDPRI